MVVVEGEPVDSANSLEVSRLCDVYFELKRVYMAGGGGGWREGVSS